MNITGSTNGKILVVLLGGSGAGKTTLRQAICGTGGEEHKAGFICKDRKSRLLVTEFVTYAVFPNGTALAGNLVSGSDSVCRMEALRQVVDLCLTHRDIVIIDTLRATQKFVNWIEAHPTRPAALFVFVNPRFDINVAQLRERRRRRGVVESALPPRTFWNLFAYRSRAQSVWEYAHSQYLRQPVRFLEITQGTPMEGAGHVLELLGVLQASQA